MKKGDRIRVVSVDGTPYAKRFEGMHGVVEGISPDTVNVKLDEGYLLSLPLRNVGTADPAMQRIEELFAWIDEWCDFCPVLDEDVCENCIIRYLSEWAEAKRKQCGKN